MVALAGNLVADQLDTVSAARVECIVGDLEGTIKARFPEIRHLFLAAKGE